MRLYIESGPTCMVCARTSPGFPFKNANVVFNSEVTRYSICFNEHQLNILEICVWIIGLLYAIFEHAKIVVINAYTLSWQSEIHFARFA